MVPRYVFLLLLLLTAVQPLHAGTDSELLAAVLQGCKQAVSSVTSSKGQVVVHTTLETSAGGTLETKTTYNIAFRGDLFRLTARADYLQNAAGPLQSPTLLFPAGSVIRREASYDGQKALVLASDPRPQGWVADASARSGNPMFSDYAKVAVWAHDLLKLQKHVNAGVVQPSLAGRETVDGDECVIVQFAWTTPSPTGGEIADCVWFWVDTQKGFAVRRIRSWSTGGIYSQKTLTAESIVELRDLGAGLWVPSAITYDEYRLAAGTTESRRVSRQVVTYAPEFRCNVPVSDAELAPVQFPSGTTVYDEVLQTDYTVP